MRLPTAALVIGAGLTALGCGKTKAGMSTGAGGTGGAAGAGGAGGAIGAGGSDVDASTADGSPDDVSTFDGPPTPPFTGAYHMGADITWVQHDEYYGASYVDTDGTTKDILDLLKNHGFNSVRMRAYVDERRDERAPYSGAFDGFVIRH